MMWRASMRLWSEAELRKERAVGVASFSSVNWRQAVGSSLVRRELRIKALLAIAGSGDSRD
jgi:hypothetical protein